MGCILCFKLAVRADNVMSLRCCQIFVLGLRNIILANDESLHNFTALTDLAAVSLVVAAAILGANMLCQPYLIRGANLSLFGQNLLFSVKPGHIFYPKKMFVTLDLATKK